MNARLAELVEEVRAAHAEPLAPRPRLERVRAAAGRLVGTRVELPAALRVVPAEGYGRNLVHRDADHGFVVVAMVWPPGVGGLPHDHGTWGVAAVSEGRLLVTEYEREDDGSVPGRARLRPRCTIEAGPGAVATVLPPHDDYHRIVNPSPIESALSIHVYGRDITACSVFDLEAGTCARIEPAYTNAD